MPWYVLLIIALAGLALVLGMFAVGRPQGVASGQARHGRVTPRDATGRGTHPQGDEAAAAADHLSADAEQLTASIARMQASLARLQVVSQALSDALRPYMLIAGWLSGEREWSELGL